MSNLRPTLCASSVAEISPQALQQSFPGLEGVIFDLDKTLVGQHDEQIPFQNVQALVALGGAGLKLGIISNAASQTRSDRVMSLAETVRGIVGTEISVVTSRDASGKKKPLRPVFDKMSELAGIPNDRLCYVGDQLLKDVLGANRAGYAGSVLVAPYGCGDDPRVKYLQRPLEAAIRPFLGLPFRLKAHGQDSSKYVY